MKDPLKELAKCNCPFDERRALEETTCNDHYDLYLCHKHKTIELFDKNTKKKYEIDPPKIDLVSPTEYNEGMEKIISKGGNIGEIFENMLNYAAGVMITKTKTFKDKKKKSKKRK